MTEQKNSSVPNFPRFPLSERTTDVLCDLVGEAAKDAARIREIHAAIQEHLPAEMSHLLFELDDLTTTETMAYGELTYFYGHDVGFRKGLVTMAYKAGLHLTPDHEEDE